MILIKKKWVLVLILIISLSLSLTSSVTANDNRFYKIVSSDSSGLKLKLNFPPPILTTIDTALGKFTKISLKNYQTVSSAGQPNLPVVSLPFYVPEGASVKMEWQGKSNEVILKCPPLPETKPIVIYSKKGVPVRLEKRFILSREIYNKNVLFPKSPVSISEKKYFRELRLQLLHIYPYQVNAFSKRVKMWQNLTVKISFVNSDKKYSSTFCKPAFPFLTSMLEELAINSKALFSNQFPVKSRLVTKKHRLPYKYEQTKNDTKYRIKINKTGMFKINQASLVKAGMDVSQIDPRKIAMYKNGVEIQIIVIGEEDGSFDTTDKVLFYGIGKGNNYVDWNVYWLGVKDVNGLRMTDVNVAPGIGTTVVTSFLEQYHFEENNIFWGSIPNGAGFDHWFWDKIISPDAKQYTFHLDFLTLTSSLSMKVKFHGYTYASSVNPDHHVKFFINENEVYNHYFDGQIVSSAEFQVASDYLQDGRNVLKIKVPGDTGASQDAVNLNYFEYTYERLLQTNNDQLIFSLSETGAQKATISSFSSNTLFFFDITLPEQVKNLTNFSIDNLLDSYQATFEVNQTAPCSYVILTEDKFLKVISIIKDTPSSLRNTGNGADLIVISPNSFQTVLEPFVNHRQMQGYRVSLVDIQDIYDEFSDGLLSPDAITEFLNYAYNYWQTPAPIAVFLVGDANFDFNNYLQTDIKNFIPNHFVETDIMGQTVSDYPFTCVSGKDELPDLFLGRCTASSIMEVQAFVNKVITYETEEILQKWNQNVLLVADDDMIFESYQNSLETDYFTPYCYNTNKVYLGKYSGNVAQAKQDIIDNISAGQFLSFYLGHGGIEDWSGQNLFNTSDVSSFSNNERSTVLITSSCLNGYFAHPEIEKGMSEEWIRFQQKGAINTISSTALSYANHDNKYHHRFLDEVLINNETNVGVAATNAVIMAYLYDNIPLDHLKALSILGAPLTLLRKPIIIIPVLSYIAIIILIILLSIFILIFSNSSGKKLPIKKLYFRNTYNE